MKHELKYNSNDVITEQLLSLDWLLEHAELIGSRGLEVHEPQSDYDFLVLVDEKNMNKYYKDCDDKTRAMPYSESYKFTPRIENYLNYVPPLNNTALIRFLSNRVVSSRLKVDVIIMTKSEDYDVLKTAYDTMKTLPKVLLQDKNDRIGVLGKLLKSSNWISAWSDNF